MARDDVKKFESIPGIGKKLAQRLVVELKDKVGQLPPVAPAKPAAPAARLPATRSWARAPRCRTSASRCARPRRPLRGAPDDASLEELVKYALTREKEKKA